MAETSPDLDAIRSAVAEAMHKALCGYTNAVASYHGMADAALNFVRTELERLTAAHEAAMKLIDYAYTLRAYGEHAPGGGETWAGFDRRLEQFLHQHLGESDTAPAR